MSEFPPAAQAILDHVATLTDTQMNILMDAWDHIHFPEDDDDRDTAHNAAWDALDRLPDDTRANVHAAIMQLPQFASYTETVDPGPPVQIREVHTINEYAANPVFDAVCATILHVNGDPDRAAIDTLLMPWRTAIATTPTGDPT